MPIYEYVCQTCRHRFEKIVNGGAAASCPNCQSGQLEQQFSTFAVGSGRSAAASAQPLGACGSCGDPRGPGSCALD